MTILALTLGLITASPTIVTKPVIYSDGKTKLAGEVVYDAAKKGKRPIVIVFHDWDGPDAYEHMRAEKLAALGYMAFVADIYGQGVRPHSPEKNMAEANKYYGNKALFRKRTTLALNAATRQPYGDRHRIGAIGYCFGGSAAIELAQTGVNVKGIVSFHGGLGPVPDAKKIKGQMLILHGAADPFVSANDLSKFRKDLDGAAVRYKFVSYPGAVHAFTIPEVDKYGLDGAKYNAEADKKSWDEMKTFFTQALKK